MESKVNRLVQKCAEKLGSNLALAKYLGSHERTIYRWLSGESKPSAEFVLAMCELVNGKKII